MNFFQKLLLVLLTHVNIIFSLHLSQMNRVSIFKFLKITAGLYVCEALMPTQSASIFGTFVFAKTFQV